jgi:hypothetical protein
MLLLSVLVLIGGQILVSGVTLWAIRRVLRAETDAIMAEIGQSLLDFVTAPDDKTPSLMAAYVDQIALVFSARLYQQITGKLASSVGGENLGKNLAVADEMMQSNPILSIAAAFLPKSLRNTMLRNPQFVGALSKMGNRNGGGSDGGGSMPSVQDRIRRK